MTCHVTYLHIMNFSQKSHFQGFLSSVECLNRLYYWFSRFSARNIVWKPLHFRDFSQKMFLSWRASCVKCLSPVHTSSLGSHCGWCWTSFNGCEDMKNFRPEIDNDKTCYQLVLDLTQRKGRDKEERWEVFRFSAFFLHFTVFLDVLKT